MDVLLNAAAARRRGPPPVVSSVLPPPAITHQRFRRVALNRKMEEQNSKKEGVFIVKTSMRPAVEHGMAPPIRTLKPIDLTEIATKVNAIHKGRVLFVRTIDTPYRILGTMILVEDDLGNCVQAGVYNYLLASEEHEDFFTKGTFIAFLEPYMRHSQDNPEAPLLLRCDNPQCIVVFESREAWIAAKMLRPAKTLENVTPTALRKKGNELFQCDKFNQARSAYTNALSLPGIDDENKIACLSNRAEANLRLELWEQAEADSRKVLELDPDNAKAKHRFARALLRLNRIEEGHEIISLLQRNGVRDKTLQLEASRLLRESKGSYDISAMRKEANLGIFHANFINPALNIGTFHANFINPALNIGTLVERPSIGKYRGCVALNDIDEGDIISASKALAFVPDRPGNPNLCFQANITESQGLVGSGLELVSEIVTLLHRRPQLTMQFYRLSTGQEASSPDENDLIDLSRIHDTQSANSFAVHEENASLRGDWLRIQKEQDLGRLLSEDERRKENETEKASRGSGIWITESFYNHSCNPNCAWTQIKDHMFIRSTRKIRKNEEITLSYVPLDATYNEKCEIFSRWIRPGIGFACACDYCDLMRSNSKQRAMEAEVDSAYAKAAQLVSFQGMKMATAAEKVLPEKRRLEILSAHAPLPPKLRHRPIERVETMQGAVLQSRGKNGEAHRCYERAAEVEYAISGASYLYAKALWRLVGSSMNCGKTKDAMKHLCRIKNLPCFQEFPKCSQQGAEAFVYLTVRYAMPWWQDKQIHGNQHALEALALKIWSKRS